MYNTKLSQIVAQSKEWASYITQLKVLVAMPNANGLEPIFRVLPKDHSLVLRSKSMGEKFVYRIEISNESVFYDAEWFKSDSWENQITISSTSYEAPTIGDKRFAAYAYAQYILLTNPYSKKLFKKIFLLSHEFRTNVFDYRKEFKDNEEAQKALASLLDELEAI